ncbi:MAG TPA: N-acetylmuramoyl-L-alanine amidase [Kofleriaceae bacterium]|nr:N-acetylmuramoyl-L-alanine amidase [Kofleriaceae bacterium]
MSKLILAGKDLDGDLPQLKTWREPPYWDAQSECIWTPEWRPGMACTPQGATSSVAKNTGTKRYAYRPSLRRYYMGGSDKQPPLDAAKAVINKFVFHHDGCPDAASCWRTLQNDRGLSVHFIIDGDGTIYQTCDLALMAYHAAQFNLNAIGVEINNRGDANKEPHYYTDRRTVACQIGASKILAWDFTDAQYASLNDLARVLVKHLPNLPLDFPQDPTAPGKQMWGVLQPGADGDSLGVPGFAGYLGHYHCTKRKWDPGAFDFKKFTDKLKRTRVFPMWAGTRPADESLRPEIPKEAAEIEKQAEPYYEANERDADGGFYPIGPWGVARLWHGGVHLPGTENDPVYAAFAGRVVAARTETQTPIGSGNFVLTRHDLNMGSKNLRFWMLSMHLADEKPGDKNAPAWMSGSTWGDAKVVDDVHILDEPVDAGIQIGRVGVVGPDTLSKPQIHLEVFARTNLFSDEEYAEDWTVIDGTAGGRFSEVKELNDLIDEDHDNRLSRQELKDFYGGAEGENAHKIVSYNISEWTEEPDWATSLKASMYDFKQKSPKRKGKKAGVDDDDEDLDVDEMVEDQLKPFLWWTNDVAVALGLPSDGVVYHYHPIRFIEWVNSKLAEGSSKETVVAAAETTEIDTNVLKGDIDDVTGDSAFVDVDAPDPDDSKIELEYLLDGFDGEKKLFPESAQ